MKSFELQIITPAGIKFKGRAESLQAETQDGQIGVLANHCPYFTLLAAGLLAFRSAGSLVVDYRLVCRDGFLRFNANHCTILAEFAQLPEEIDPVLAKNTIAELEAKLKNRQYSSPAEKEKLKEDLKIARCRQQLAGRA